MHQEWLSSDLDYRAAEPESPKGCPESVKFHMTLGQEASHTDTVRVGILDQLSELERKAVP